jgi:hypothetical protein
MTLLVNPREPKTAALALATFQEARPYQSNRWILVNRCRGVELAHFGFDI